MIPTGTSLASAKYKSFLVSCTVGPLLAFATTIPSKPIFISVISVMPFFAHSFTSFILILLDALVMSGVDGPLPAQNNLRPPPEPVDSMIGALKPLSALPNSSATTVAKG